jgi:hypothetical protein
MRSAPRARPRPAGEPEACEQTPTYGRAGPFRCLLQARRPRRGVFLVLGGLELYSDRITRWHPS